MLAGTMNFRDAVRIMWDNVNLSWEDAMALLKGTLAVPSHLTEENVNMWKVDAKFPDLLAYCKEKKIPFVVVSRLVSSCRGVGRNEKVDPGRKNVQLLASDN
ncbi:hypothetical protein HK097_006123 [Rhizophlyctis rosea]|uniref:Uncharacterized protein n=1 Tax=Rhizophlyctis rosea TaxID=64517 RepID=A0AAD5SFZ9_9FUNG|nr:hypothetical protein HK097_006123 [Rhizophlyctis rosea]